MDKTSGVAAVANALAVMALRVQRSRETMAQEEQARAFNRKFEGEMSNRSRPVRRNAEHTRMPFILMAGRPDNGGDIGFAGGGGGMGASATQGMPRSLQGSDVPLGYDEGMVRMASAIGSDLALMHEKNAAFLGFANKGGALSGLAAKRVAKIPKLTMPKMPTAPHVPTPHVPPGVGAPKTSVGSPPSMSAGVAAQPPGGRKVSPAWRANQLNGAGGLQNVSPVGAHNSNGYHGNTRIRRFAGEIANPQPAAAQSAGLSKPPVAATATPRPITAGTPAPQQGGMGTWNKPPATATPKPVQPQQPAGQPYRAPAPAAATPPPAPPPQAPPPAAPAPPNQVMAGSAEANARPGATADNAVKETWEDKLRTHVDRAKKDLGNGQWKGKGLALAGMAAGTYGAYRGAKALGNFMAKEPAHHASNEGGAIPAYGVNQYGVADRSTPFNY